jgi:iron complex transport system substrate-binding protein
MLAIGLAVLPAAWAEIRVQDQRGKSLVLPQPATRIVTIPIPMASIIMALDGSSRRIVGMHPAARQSIQEGFLYRIFPEALAIQADVTRGGMFTPNIESIMALQPDLVVQWTEPADLISILEGAGLTVVGLIDSPPSQEVHERNLTIIGEVIGQRERVAQLIRRQREQQQHIETALAGLAASAKPRVLYLRSLSQNIRPAGPNTYQDFWIRLAGGVNVVPVAGMHTAVNLEQLIAWNPEVIFIGTFDSATPDDLLRHPILASIDAVRQRRVYKLPHGGYRWDPGSHESHLLWQWTTMLLHPTRARFNLRDAMRETYQFLYRYELTDADIDEILQMPLNASMDGYTAFAR